ncbi:MAG: acylneuraminate cytidylyltransferase family protein [Muribaculaceae bacterium]|nr:acylneuraminate cytidylyltransferase family protein [Muribaculaceae bacterium]
MKPLYIIPARGGSKSIPGKNIKPLAGKPLIGYSIETALALATPDRVIVTTDSERIADVAREFGIARPHMRPAELATDTAGSREVMLDAMAEARRRGVDFDVVVLLQPTSPLRTADDVSRTLEAWRSDIDMAVTVCAAPCNPYYDCFETDADGFLHVSKGDGLLTRRQMAPPAWQFNGAVYAITPQSLAEKPLGAMTRRVPVEMSRERSVDLDTPFDWALCEMIMKSSASETE